MEVLVDAALHDAHHHRDVPDVSLADRAVDHDLEQIEHFLRHRAAPRLFVQPHVEDRPVHRVQRVALLQRRVALAQRLHRLPRRLLPALRQSFLLLRAAQRGDDVRRDVRSGRVVRQHFRVGRDALGRGQDGVVHFAGEVAREGLGVLENEGDLVENGVESVQRGVFDALLVGDVRLEARLGVLEEHGEVAERGEGGEKLAGLEKKREKSEAHLRVAVDKNAAEKIAVRELLVHEAVLEGILHGVHELHGFLVETAEQIAHDHADVVSGALALQQLVVFFGLFHKGSH